jgi:large conductance mechanosensitive channel
MIKGFKEFLLRGNVIDLAVAVVIGAAFGAIVTAFVKDIITPLIAAIFGKPSFEGLSFTINKSQFNYGDFLNATVNFVLIAAAIYFFVVVPIKHVTELRARRRAAGEEPDAASPVSDEALLLTEIRDLLRGQQV